MTISVLVAAAGLLYVRYVRPPFNVAYVSEEEGGIKVINLSTLQVVRGVQPADIAPRGIGITFDGKFLITADKDTSDIAIFGTPRLNVAEANKNWRQSGIHQVRSELAIGFSPLSNRALRAAASGGRRPAADDADDENEPPAQIATFHVPDWTPGSVSTAGKETEGLEFSPDGKYMIVANEAQNTIGLLTRPQAPICATLI